MTVYDHLPIWGQNLACYVEGKKNAHVRYGKIFWKYLSEYRTRDTWSYAALCEYRDNRLRKMIKHCYETVPYYKTLFDDGGINPKSIKNLDDLKKLPVLTKDIVNENPKLFLSAIFPKKRMITSHTSGTTGAGFVFKTSQQAICEQWAVWWRYRENLGIKYGTLHANFGTRFVVPVKQTKPPFWRYNKPCHQIYFSAFHEKPDYLKYYIEEIINKNITWIHGYPSLLTELANEVIREGLDLSRQIKYVTIGAENLLEYQTSIMQRAFGVHVYQHYGLTEGVANFSEKLSKEIVVDEDFSAVEFVPCGETNKIIATSLTNYAMPLLRWDTNDTAEYKEDLKKGRIVTSIDGRIEDYIVLPNGRKIGKLDHVFKDTTHLKEVQIVQERDYNIHVLIVPRDGQINNDILLASELFKKTLGSDVGISFEIVDHIQKSRSGKHRFIVSAVGKS